MNFYFEYFYYRVCKLYFRFDGEDGTRALICVTLCQTGLLASVIVFLLRQLYTKSELASYSKVTASIVVFGAVILHIINFRKLNGRYNEFNTFWKDESPQLRIRKGFLVLLSFIVPWLLFVFVSF